MTSLTPVASLNPLFVQQLNENFATLDAAQVATLAQLKATPAAAPAVVSVACKTTIGDGWGGLFALDPTDTTTPDDGAMTIADTIGRRWKRIYDGPVSAKWFGAKGDGATDDTAALQAACDYQAARGGGKVDLSYGKWLIDSADLELGRNVVLSGPWLMPGTGAGYLRIDISGFRAVIIVNPAYTVRAMGDSAGIEGLAIYNKNVFNGPTPTTLRENLDRIKLFGGVGITVGDGTGYIADEFSIRNCFIGGFEYGIYSDFNSRPRIDHIFGDNLNGIYITKCYDMDYISNVHFWPSLTPAGGATALATYTVIGATNNGSGLIRLQTSAAHVLETGDTKIVVKGVGGVPASRGTWTVTRVDDTHIDLQGSTFSGSYTSGGTIGVSVFKRDGIGIHLDEHTDWGQLTTCFCYGYQVAGIKIESSNYTTLNNCGADNYSVLEDQVPVGIWIAGTAKAAALIGCKAAANGTNLRIETAGTSDEDVALVTNFRSWGAVTYIYEILDGVAQFVGCHGQTTKTIRVGANAGAVSFIGGNLTGVTMSYETGAPLASFRDCNGATSPSRSVSNGVNGSRIIAEDVAHNSSPAADDSLTRRTYFTNSSGVDVEAVRQTARLASVTAGAEEGQLFWAVRSGGVLADKLLLTGTFLASISNGAIALGSPTLGWSGACFSANTKLNWGNSTYTITQGGTNVTFSGSAVFGSYIKPAVYTVGTLPAAATAGAGARAQVSDANTTLAAGIGTTAVGGGANNVPVVSNGTNWLIG